MACFLAFVVNAIISAGPPIRDKSELSYWPWDHSNLSSILFKRLVWPFNFFSYLVTDFGSYVGRGHPIT